MFFAARHVRSGLAKKDLLNHEAIGFVNRAARARTKKMHAITRIDARAFRGLFESLTRHLRPFPRFVRVFACAITSVLGVLLSHAHAQGPVAAIFGQISGGEDRVQAVFSFDRAPEMSRLVISSPYRLVIDLAETTFAFGNSAPVPRGLITDIRYGLMQEGKSRIVITTKGPFSLDRFDVRKQEKTGGYELAIELSQSTASAFEKLLDTEAERTGATATSTKADRIGKASRNSARPFTVVLDAGHGGIDGGARGLTGTEEKDVTLAFVQELQALLGENPSIRTVLTRSDDTFLPLAERVQIARQNEADIFIAVHADTISAHGLRGATVYTNSERASDDVAQAVASNENLSDAVAGLSVETRNADVSDILVDLMRRETQKFSVSFANLVVGKFDGAIRLINNPHRFAGFVVLRAPDVPSILVELGYLSNPQDEKLLTDAKWRRKAAELLVASIEAYAAAHKGDRQ